MAKATRVIPFINQKGGVGKTTSILNIGLALARMPEKFRVLIIDLDPQCNASLSLGVRYPDLDFKGLDLADFNTYTPDYDEDFENDITSIGHLIYQKINSDPDYKLKDAIQNKELRLDFIPAHPEMALFDDVWALIEQEERDYQFKPIIDELKQLQITEEGRRRTAYDFILIDCNPSLGYFTRNAMMAASDVIVPIAAEYYPVVGFRQLLHRLAQAKLSGAQIENIRVLLTMSGRTNVAKEAIELIRKIGQEHVFKRIIGRYVAVQEAPMRGMTVIESKPSSPAAKAYKAIAKELAKLHN